jgi:hypothetical protein
VVNVSVPPFGDDHTALLMVETWPTPVTVKCVESATVATVMSVKLYAAGAMPRLVTWLPTARPWAAAVVNVSVPPAAALKVTVETRIGAAGVHTALLND